MIEKLVPYFGLLKVALLLAAVVGLFASGYHTGAGNVRDKWAAADRERLAAEQTATVQRLDDNAKVAAQQATEKQTLKKGYEDEIATLRRNAASSDRMHRNAGICEGFTRPAETDGAGRGNATVAGTGALSQPDARDSSELMPARYQAQIDALQDEADRIVASCRVGQKFIKDNGFAP